MLDTIQDAKATLEQQGLHVSFSNDHSLWIAGKLEDVGEGIKLSHDACALFATDGQWIAVFPAEGIQTCEVPGTPTELVSTIAAAYADYRSAGGYLKMP